MDERTIIELSPASEETIASGSEYARKSTSSSRRSMRNGRTMTLVCGGGAADVVVGAPLSASRNSAADAKRALGSFSRQRMTTRASCGGTSAGRSGGRSSRMAAMVASELSPRNGRRPLSASYRTLPRANKSVWAVMSPLRICSGAMYGTVPTTCPALVASTSVFSSSVARMRSGETGCHRHRDVDRFAPVKFSPIEPTPQRLAAQQLGDRVPNVVIFRKIEYRDDVRMRQSRDCFRFPLEALTHRRVVGDLVGDDLEGDVAVEPPVTRPVHRAHSPFAEEIADLVRTESRAGLEGHVRRL